MPSDPLSLETIKKFREIILEVDYGIPPDDPIPAGADPIWQPAGYLQGCAGWVAMTHLPDSIWSTEFWEATPWLIPMCQDPFAGLKTLFANTSIDWSNWRMSFGSDAS